MLRRRRAVPAPAGVSALQFIGASLFPDTSGWWVYALCDARTGLVFYAGQSDHLISRLRDHSYNYAERFDPARIWVCRVADRAEADLYELLLIRHYDPECNTLGRRRELEKRLRGQNAPEPPQLRRRMPLDPSQATG